MAYVNDAMQSADERPIGLRARRDLVIQESEFQGETCWIVKDPLAMKYFRLKDAEYAVLSRLEEPCSYRELLLMLSRQFPEKTTRLEGIQRLVISFHRNGLLISDRTGQAAPLKKRRNKELRRKAIGLMSSLIALRLPGFDADRLLTWMHPRLRWLFTRWFAMIVVLTGVSALTLIITDFEHFYSRLPGFRQFFAFDNLLFMGVLLIFTKTIHEFGHGLTCKHYGGECHEIGFMFLVFTPVMFCNTSDSWILPNRCHRIAIGAAGMYFELFMGAICTLIWWYTNPGWVHYMALNIMFLSTVTTIVFNANPLLRYDGYYMLSDFLEIPNLASKSRLSLMSKLRVWCLGMKPVNTRQMPSRHQLIFALYSVASFVYRWMVLIFIFWLISEIFEPYGLSVVGHAMILISLFGMVIVPGYRLVKFFLQPGRTREVKRKRFATTLVISGLVIGLFCFLPLPDHVRACFVIRPYNAQQVKVTQPGNLISWVKPGQQVTSGQLLATLENHEIILALERSRGNLARLQNDLVAFQLNRSTYLDAARKITQTVTEIDSQTKQIEILEKQLSRLELRANRAGQVIPAPNRPLLPVPEGELARWSGSPLDPQNQNAYLEADTLLCMIGDPGKFQAELMVSQSDVKLVESGQPVLLLLQTQRGHFFRAEVVSVSRDELNQVPRELSQTNGGPIAIDPDAVGGEKPLLKFFRVDVIITDLDQHQVSIPLRTGFRGVAKIRVGNASLGTRTLRLLRNLINFR